MSHRALPALVSSLAILVGICGISGCGSLEDEPYYYQARPGTEQYPNTIKVEGTTATSNAVTQAVNQYRYETFLPTIVKDGYNPNLTDKAILHTAAKRHAVNLATANSSTYWPLEQLSYLTDISGIPITPADTGTINTDTGFLALRRDYQPGSGTLSGATIAAMFPMHYTNALPLDRIRSMIGGPDMVYGTSDADVFENYVADGLIPDDAIATNCALRGFPLSAQTAAAFSGWTATIADTLWYSRIGRIMLMRYGMTAFSYAEAAESGMQTPNGKPPFPIVNDQFKGVAIGLNPKPQINKISHWPARDAVDVIPFGLDTSSNAGEGAPATPLDGAAAGSAAETQPTGSIYTGPPIHITLDTVAPWYYEEGLPGPGFGIAWCLPGASFTTHGFGMMMYLRRIPNGGTDSTGAAVGTDRLGNSVSVGTAPAPKIATVYRQYNVFYNAGGSGGGAEWGAMMVGDAAYAYAPTGVWRNAGAPTAATRSANYAYQTDNAGNTAVHASYVLRPGELMIIPTTALQSDAWYEVGFHLEDNFGRIFPSAQDKLNPYLAPGIVDHGITTARNDGETALFYTWKFKTRAMNGIQIH